MKLKYGLIATLLLCTSIFAKTERPFEYPSKAYSETEAITLNMRNTVSNYQKIEQLELSIQLLKSKINELSTVNNSLQVKVELLQEKLSKAVAPTNSVGDVMITLEPDDNNSSIK